MALRRPLTLHAVVETPEPLRALLATLGLAPPVTATEAGLARDVWRLGNAVLVVSAPPPGHALHDRLATRGAGVFGLGHDGAAASLPQLGVELVPASAAPAADPAAPLLLDHVAFAVPALDPALDAAADRLGLAEAPGLGRWRFPALGVENAVLPVDGAYIELNRPEAAGGLFGGFLERQGPGAVFACLRFRDAALLDAAVQAAGSPLGAPQPVVAAPAAGEPRAIGRVFPLSRRLTSGLLLMVFDGDWPWSLLGA